MLPKPKTGGRTGLWQDPTQLAAALLQLGSSRKEIRTYVEVGCFTAWTTAVVATYLQRVGHRLRGITIDVYNYTTLTHQILESLNVTFENRVNISAAQAARRLHPHRPHRPPVVDLCFIDAGHSFEGVSADFFEFAPHCATSMFHDIQDLHTMHLSNFSGGVPAFWHRLVSHSAAGRATSFTFQIAIQTPVFGLGILKPNSNGTAEPDVPFDSWPPWPPVCRSDECVQRHRTALGRAKAPLSASALQAEFCAAPTLNFERICSFRSQWLVGRPDI